MPPRLIGGPLFSTKALNLRISKIDAAERQLNAAIRFMFAGVDPVVVHTLVGAASIVMFDLVEASESAEAWERKLAEDSGLSVSEYLAIARRAQNFFKHARSDAEAELEFDPRESEILLFSASLNWGRLLQLTSSDRKLSTEMSVFQIWFIAGWHKNWLGREDAAQVQKLVDHLFPNFADLDRNEKLARGLVVLEAEQNGKAT